MKLNYKKLIWVPLMVILSFSFIFVCRISSSPPPTKIYIDPVSTTAPQGQSVTVNVKVVGASDFYGYQFYLSWNSVVLEVTDVEEGDFPGRSGVYQTSFIEKRYNNEGYILVSGTLKATVRGVDGAGTLAIITFTVESSAASGLFLYNVVVNDSFLQHTPFVLEDGYVNVAAPKFHVEPSVIDDPALTASESFTINVTLSDVDSLSSFGFRLAYDTTLLNATNVSVVRFLNEPQVIDKGINQTLGFVWVTVNAPAAVPSSGGGTVANVTFSVRDVGETVLDIYDTQLNDTLFRSRGPAFGHIPPAEDGYFSNIPLGHDIRVSRLTPLPVKLTEGQSVYVNVTVMNVGAFNETFDVTLSYSNTVIETKHDVTLNIGEKKILSFEWNTANVSPGTYILKAEASVVEGETKKSNNVLTYSSIIIEPAPSSNIYLYAGVVAVVAVLAVGIVYFMKVKKTK